MGIFRKSKLPQVTISWLDLKISGLCGIFAGFILMMLIPQLLEVSIWWFVILGVLCLVRVYYVILKK